MKSCTEESYQELFKGSNMDSFENFPMKYDNC